MYAARLVRLFPVLLCLLAIPGASAFGGEPAAQGEPPAAAPRPAPIPLAEIGSRAASTADRLRVVESALQGAPAIQVVTDELPGLSSEIDNRLLENRRLLEHRPPLEMLRTIEAGWRRVRETLAQWTRELARIDERLGRDLDQVAGLEKTWAATRDEAAAQAPADVLARIEAQVEAVRRVQRAVEEQRARLVALQGRVAVQDARVGDAIGALRQAREDMVNQLLVKDSPAIWDRALREDAARLDAQARSSFSAQFFALRDYVEHRPSRFLLHALVLALIAACFYWARGQLERWLPHEPDLARTALVFRTPLATALVVTLFAMRSIYPEAPRLLWAAFGAAALVPTVYILRRLVARELRPTLYVLVAFYLIDQVRAVAAALAVLPRALFLVEMLAGAVFSAWLVRTLRHPRGDRAADRLRLTMKAAALAAVAVCLVTFVASATGYVRLANLLGNAALLSAYFAMILYVMVAIVDGLVMIALRERPLRLLGMVERHRVALRHRVRRVLQWIAIVVWALFVLERLTIRERAEAALRNVLTSEASVGALHVSLGDVLAFALTVWASFMVSRLVRFLLEEDVYPRVHLGRGLPYAISTMTHYVILVVGFFAAMAALGLDMTKATILAGAFTVGVGFGLQNIFNNFVSGLILLFERPVKVGDVIEMDANATGVVERIGIRASMIRVPNGAQLIVPNGKLISDRFTNWTYATRARSIEVPVSVVLNSDVAKAIATLERIAAGHELVTDHPPPQAMVTRLGPDWMGLLLRAWTDRAADWVQIESDLSVRIAQELPAAGITLR